jgi:2,4-dienoyl-CoA reductase-like NADH-dependent reductase (Old Yellow Enzyme family)
VVYVGGVLSLQHAEEALSAGCDFVQVGRATIRDPAFASRLAFGQIRESDCDLCNRCIAAMEAGGVRCISAERGLLPRPF